MKVQQERVRHVSIQTTMNVCGQAMSRPKEKENGKVVELARPCIGKRLNGDILLGVYRILSERPENRKLLILLCA